MILEHIKQNSNTMWLPNNNLVFVCGCLFCTTEYSTFGCDNLKLNQFFLIFWFQIDFTTRCLSRLNDINWQYYGGGVCVSVQIKVIIRVYYFSTWFSIPQPFFHIYVLFVCLFVNTRIFFFSFSRYVFKDLPVIKGVLF